MARQKNRRFCTDLPDLALPSPSPREDKNTDNIDTFYTINYDEPPPMVSPGGESTAYLFNHVQDGNRRRYRAILSLVSTMTLIATAVAIISVTAKKMSSSDYNGDNNQNTTEDGLGFEKYSLPPAMDDGKEPLFPKPPIYAQIDVTAPPAMSGNRPNNNANEPATSPEKDDEEDTGPGPIGALFDQFPPISVVRAPSPWPTPSPHQQQDDDGLDYVFKRPSVLDLTRAPVPPTIHPSFQQPTSNEPTIAAETQVPTNPPRPGEPTRAPSAPIFDLVRPPALSVQIHPTTAPENVVILNDDYIGYLFDKYKNKDDADDGVDGDDDDIDNIAVSNKDDDDDEESVTKVPSKQPVASTLMPTFSPTGKPTRPPRTKRPTDAPVAEIVIIDDEEFEEEPTSNPTSSTTSEATEEPTTELTEEPTSETTEEPTPAITTKPTDTLRPKRTRRPTSAPVTMVPTSEAPVASTLAPVRVTMPPQHEITEEDIDLPEASPSPTFKPSTSVPTKSPVSSPPTASPTESTEPPAESTEVPVVEETPPQVDEQNDDATAEAVVMDDGTVTYEPGDLTVSEAGLKLSTGLTARILATTGKAVVYADGTQSKKVFHGRPDAGQTFPDTRPENPGGWVYVSNSEMRHDDPPGGQGNGGVGAITFDKGGNILSYDMILEGSTWNCGGGRTPWNTWVSCEEAPKGRIWQTDPMGVRQPELLTMGSDTGGAWESFTYDIRDLSAPHFFVTEDAPRGALLRWTPDVVNWQEPWGMLHGTGKTEYLVLTPNAQGNGGTYEWVSDRSKGRDNAKKYYPNCEGIDSDGESIFFVSKKILEVFELDLNSNKYTNDSTQRGLFDGKPDQVQRILKSGTGQNHEHDILYFTEEGGKDAGVHGRGPDGRFFTILEGPSYKDETSGLAFSPDGMHLYIAFQENGVLLDVTREDGKPFQAQSLDVKFHNLVS